MKKITRKEQFLQWCQEGLSQKAKGTWHSFFVHLVWWFPKFILRWKLPAASTSENIEEKNEFRADEPVREFPYIDKDKIFITEEIFFRVINEDSHDTKSFHASKPFYTNAMFDSAEYCYHFPSLKRQYTSIGEEPPVCPAIAKEIFETHQIKNVSVKAFEIKVTKAVALEWDNTMKIQVAQTIYNAVKKIPLIWP